MEADMSEHSATLTSRDCWQLAGRCARIASECTTPSLVQALRTLALDYLSRADIPLGQRQSIQRDQIMEF
jgi:hypothetical protein